MAEKTKFDIYLDASVASGATDLQTSAIVPTGKIVRILNFGGFDPLTTDLVHSAIAIQWGSGTTWKTLRSGGGGTFDFDLKKDIVGDGTKRLRLVRKNNSSAAKNLAAWLYAVIL